MKVVVVAVASLLATTSLTSCSGTTDLGVATSFYPLTYVAQRIVGKHFPVTNLTKPGQEPHDTELSIKVTASLAKAKVVFYEKGLSGAVDDAVAVADPQYVVDASAAADLEDDDPHFWLDPTRLSAVAAEFEKTMAAADPDHARAYAANLAALHSDLAELDTDIRAGLAHCRIHTIVVSHDAFAYFGQRYGLKVVPIAGLSPDAEPAPAYLAELSDLVKSDQITTVFSEELASPQMADALAHDLDLTTTVLDPIEGLSAHTQDQDYVSLMRQNLATLRTADDCS